MAVNLSAQNLDLAGSTRTNPSCLSSRTRSLSHGRGRLRKSSRAWSFLLSEKHAAKGNFGIPQLCGHPVGMEYAGTDSVQDLQQAQLPCGRTRGPCYFGTLELSDKTFDRITQKNEKCLSELRIESLQGRAFFIFFSVDDGGLCFSTKLSLVQCSSAEGYNY